MFKQQRLTVLSMAVLLALLFAAMAPMSALADDGVPPTDVPAVEEVVPPVDVPVVEDVVPVVEEVVPAVEEPQTVPEILAEVPADTDVVVLDEAGESLPLASADAAEVILVSDPIWCKAGTNPSSATAGDCTLGQTTVALLLSNLGTAAGDGTIFFTSTYSVNDVTFDSGVLTTLDSLTLQGGWNGNGNALWGLTGTFGLSGNTTFSVPVSVNWNAGSNVTINNITVTGVTTAGDALFVQTTTQDIVLNNVNSNSNSSGTGASIITTTGNVTVNNSQFNSNSNTATPGEAVGLNISSDGNVTLNNVTANYNAGDGTVIDKNTTGPASVTVSNSTFNYNTSTVADIGNGLQIENVKGDVTLNNVTAMYNTLNGVQVGSAKNSGTPGNGTTGNIIVNGGQFAFNGKDGLHLNADKNITLNGVTTYGNRDDGAEVCAGKDVNINGGDFYQNQYGIYIRCGQNVNSYYGNWWDNYYWGYDWGYGWGGNYYGYYGNYWGAGWALPIWGNVTINNIYVNGYFMPNFGSYYSFFNSYYYGYGWNPYYYEGHTPYYRWLRRHRFPPIVTTKPMTVEITPLTEPELPEALPDGKTFADAFKLKTSDGVPGEVAKTSFDAPAGLADGDTVTVLSWDGTEWTEVPSEIVDGKVEFKVSGSGIFALATP